MATSYSAVAQRDDDTRDPASPPSPASPSAPTKYPAVFLSLSEPAFTPLSFDGSELEFVSGNTDVAEEESALAPADQSLPTTGARSGFGAAATAMSSSISNMVQSLAPSRATAPGNGYGLLSPAPSGLHSNVSNCSSLSSSPALIPAPSPLEDDEEENSADEETARVSLSDGVASLNPIDHNRRPPPQATAAPDTGNSTIISNIESPLDCGSRTNLRTSAGTPPFPAIVRPKPQSLHSRPQTASSNEPAPIVRTSSTASVKIRHPVPDLNTRSGAYVGNIAALEATAERFSMTSSIEDAIRDAHDQLKRSDSRRSSILAASAKNQTIENSTEGSASAQPPIPLSRQSSILETNNAARHGGYSPAGYVMSPNHSLSNRSTRLRAGSKSSATGSVGPSASNGPLPEIGNAEDFPFLSRHGPGKSSVRSVLSSRSGKMSLPEIAETEPPVTITQEALDEADRIAAAAEEHDEDDETIRAGAYQRMSLDPEIDLGLEMDTPQAEIKRPILDNAFEPQQVPGLRNEPAPDASSERERPTTSGSVMTLEQAQTAFGDFDGVHCDPDLEFDRLPEPGFPDFPPPQPRARPAQPPPPRPKSYFDPETGKQMLYYPARVPAMLNLPPKLSSNTKAAARNVRRSKVMSAMPEALRESRLWLPDPLGGDIGTPLMPSGEGHKTADSPERRQSGLLDPELDQAGEAAPQPQPDQELRRPPRLAESDRRQSRMSVLLDGLPPPLRASAFFDLPSVIPKVEVKDNSAMATLDSILDAAATAPVNAFTDHAFAGKLGAEVYGPEKKSKKRASHLRTPSKADALASLDPKKRASLFSLLGVGGGGRGGKRNSETLDVAAEGRRPTMSSRAGLQGLDAGGESASIHEDMASPDLKDDGLAPDKDEEVESGDDEEEEELYTGAPTTLLAELQLRKQQQKLRTRPAYRAYPNGMHSTLLELDAVAEVERKARRGKRVNLAWQDPAMLPDTADDEDDEDVPLGMLFAARAAGQNDISAVAAEVNRPLGLMERRELEDNEPLSRRRDRLQGREPAVPAVGLGALANLNKRQSVLALTLNGAGAPGVGGRGSPHPGGAAQDEAEEAQDEPEIEDEPLADRMRRLKGEDPNALPRARPVSAAFSAELLSQFGGDDDEKEKEKVAGKGKANDKVGARKPSGKENDPPPAASEEEETLGQRRRRLQAERDAREREIGAGAAGMAVNAAALSALTGGGNANGRTGSMDRLSRPLKMADILAAHPSKQGAPQMNPIEWERMRREEEAAQSAREKEEKMAGFRAMMPSAIPGSGVSTGAAKGGYAGGKFNDGTGGGVGVGVGPGNGTTGGGLLGMGGGMGALPNVGAGWNNHPSAAMAGYGVSQGMMSPRGGMGMDMNTNTNMNMNMNMGMGMGMGIGMGMNASFKPTNGLGGTNYAGFGAVHGAAMPMAMGMGTGVGIGLNGAYGSYGGLSMQIPTSQGQIDRVERWRQSVMP